MRHALRTVMLALQRQARSGSCAVVAHWPDPRLERHQDADFGPDSGRALDADLAFY